MAGPPSPCDRRRRVPEKHSFVTANGGERGIVRRDGKTEHFVAVSREGLHEEGTRRVEEADGAVGGAGEDLKPKRSGIAALFYFTWDIGEQMCNLRIDLSRHYRSRRGLGLPRSFFVSVSAFFFV